MPKLRNIAKQKNFGRQKLNATLLGLNSSIDRLYLLLELLAQHKEIPVNFLDLPGDKDPFHILCAHGLYYLAEHIFCPPEEGVFITICNWIVSVISDTQSVIKIRTDKETCLIKHLHLCEKKIKGLNKEGEDYESLRYTHVKEEIQTIHRENKQICEESQFMPTIPIQASALLVLKIPAPRIKPSRGRLRDSMAHALEEMIQEHPDLEREATKTLTI